MNINRDFGGDKDPKRFSATKSEEKIAASRIRRDVARSVSAGAVSAV
jgi:hypothetical protein